MKKKDFFIENFELFLPDVGFRTHTTANTYFTEHGHEFVEFFYVISGSLKHEYKGVITELSVGDLVLVTPNELHRFVETSTPSSHRDLMFPIKVFKNTCNFFSSDLFDKLTNSNCIFHKKLSFAQLDHLENYVKILLREDNKYRKAIFIKDILSTLIAYVFHDENENVEINGSYPQWLTQLLSLFNKSDIIKLGLPEIKKYTHYSYPYVCTTFKRYLGKTIVEYLNDVRMNYAAFLLKSTNLSIIDIAASVGLTSISHFNKTFKKQFGVTASKYRKGNKK